MELFRHPPARTRVSLTEVAPDVMDEPTELAFYDYPIDVNVTRKRDITEYTVHSLRPALNGQELYYLLDAVAPSKGSPIGAVVADLEMPDNVGSKSGANARLYAVHQRLGSAWTEFMVSRPAYLRLLDEAYRPPIGDHSRLEHRAFESDTVTLSQVARDIADRPTSGVDTLITLSHEAGTPQAETVVHNALAEMLNRRRHSPSRLSNPSKVRRQFEAVGRGARSEIAAAVLKQAVAAPRETVPAVAKAHLYDRVMTDDGTEYFVVPPDGVARTGGVEESAVRGLMRLGHRDSSKAINLPPSLAAFAASTIEPELRWQTRSDGSREFQLGCSEVTGEHNRQYIDKLLGILLVAYLSPDIRAGWPETMGLNRSNARGFAQRLGVAQVPVLALLPRFKQQLSQSAVLRAIEARAA